VRRPILRMRNMRLQPQLVEEMKNLRGMRSVMNKLMLDEGFPDTNNSIRSSRYGASRPASAG